MTPNATRGPQTKTSAFRERRPHLDITRSRFRTPTPSERPRPIVHVAIDVGTENLAVMARIADGSSCTIENLRPIPFINNSFEKLSCAAFLPDGSFVCGTALVNMLHEGTVHPSLVMRYYKLPLDPTAEHSHIVKTLRAQLAAAGKTIKELLCEVYKYSRSCIIAHLKECQPPNNPEMYYAIAVPEMFKAPAKKTMTDAAELAGFTNVKLIPEPLATAAYFRQCYIDDHTRQQNNFGKWLQPGKEYVVADHGGGTGDFISCRVGQGEAGDEAKIPLHVIKATGALCGGAFVNFGFMEYLRTQAPVIQHEGDGNGLAGVAARFGMPLAALEADASDLFEEKKVLPIWPRVLRIPLPGNCFRR